MRLTITRKGHLAVELLRRLAASQQPRKGKELAELIGASPAFVVHVVAPLVDAGWVRSHPGPRGGYRYAARRPGPTLLEVIEAVDGPLFDGQCLVPHAGRCATRTGGEACALHDAWLAARNELRTELSQRRISAAATEAQAQGATGGGL